MIDRDVIYRRTLHVSVRTANRDYTCDNCWHPIYIGEEYEEEAIAVHVRFRQDGRVKKMVTAWRRHAEPCFPDDEDDEDDAEDETAGLRDLPAAA